MSLTGAELEKVQQFLKDWAPDLRFSKQEIEAMCRGPMKDVFMSFLVPRFKTDEQVSVIRSNLYVNGFADAPSELNKAKADQKHLKLEMAKLKKQTEEMDVAFGHLMKQTKTLESLRSPDRSSKISSMRNHLGNLETLLAYSDSLISELRPLLLSNLHNNQNQNSNNQVSMSVIQLESIKIFRSLFFDNLQTNVNVQSENERIRKLICEFAKCPENVESFSNWQRKELMNSERILAELEEECRKNRETRGIAEETEVVKRKLTLEHINLVNSNKRLEATIANLQNKRQNLQFDILGDSTVTPTDMLKGVRVAELKAQIEKVRDLKAAAPTLDNAKSNSVPNTKDVENERRQKELEAMVGALLKGWPETKSRLECTQKVGRKIIHEDFSSALLSTDCLGNQIENGNAKLNQTETKKTTFDESQVELSALNPNRENWSAVDYSFIQGYNHNRLESVALETERLQNALPLVTSNLEVLDQLIAKANENLKKFQ